MKGDGSDCYRVGREGAGDGYEPDDDGYDPY